MDEAVLLSIQSAPRGRSKAGTQYSQTHTPLKEHKLRSLRNENNPCSHIIENSCVEIDISPHVQLSRRGTIGIELPMVLALMVKWITAPILKRKREKKKDIDRCTFVSYHPAWSPPFGPGSYKSNGYS